jgi:hypothetical protein
MATFNINAVDRRIQYTSTGQTAFNFSFQVNASSELQVYINDVLKSETTHYSVSLNTDGTGTVTFGSATTAGEIITIIGDQPLSRTTVFQTGQTNNPTTLETEFDNVLIRQQQLKELTDRSIQLKVTTPRTVTGSGTSGPLQFPYDATVSNNADKVIAYDSNGTSLILGPTTTGLTTLAGISTEVQALAGIASNITTAAGIASNITTVAGLSTQITNLSGVSASDLTTVAGIGGTVLGNVSGAVTAINAVNSNLVAINAVNSNSTNINTVSAANTNITNVNNALANINQVASNLSAISDFAGIYLGAQSSNPTQDPDGSALDGGELFFDTSSNQLKVYSSSSGWQNAGSSINGTSARFTFTISGTPTTVSGNDDAGTALSYSPNFIDVYLNGVKQVNGTDVTVTSGNSLVFASALAANDVVDCVAFGTFNVANIAASAITSGTLGSARGGTGKTTSDLSGQAGKALVVNSSQNGFDLANTSSAEIYGFKKSFTASTLNRTVTVVSVGGSNKYFIDGVQQDTLELLEGNTYVFTYPSGHPFKFSTTSDGSHGGGSEYTTGVTHNSSTQVTIVVATGAPTLYYYCSSHSGMGGQANTPIASPNTLQVITTGGGADNIDAATYDSFDDVIFASTGFTFSLSNGRLIANV